MNKTKETKPPIWCGKGISYHLGSSKLREYLTKELERILKIKQNVV